MNIAVLKIGSNNSINWAWSRSGSSSGLRASSLAISRLRERLRSSSTTCVGTIPWSWSGPSSRSNSSTWSRSWPRSWSGSNLRLRSWG